VDACTEGALEMVDGFAQLSDEKYCDGYGACISECQPGALKIEEREAEPFDEVAAEKHRKQKDKAEVEKTQINWPFKLKMVSPEAPFFKDTDLFIISDCVPFAVRNMHDVILRKNSSIIVSCPKFDELEAYREKLKTILEKSKPKSVTVVHMEIPCCNTIYGFVESIIKSIGDDITLHKAIIGTDGAVKLVL
jgi:ferredoxin